MKPSEKAVIHFQKGLNCCQAINCSYRESMGINEQQAIIKVSAEHWQETLS